MTEFSYSETEGRIVEGPDYHPTRCVRDNCEKCWTERQERERQIPSDACDLET